MIYNLFFLHYNFLYLMTSELVLLKMAAPIEPSLMISHKITGPDGSLKKVGFELRV